MSDMKFSITEAMNIIDDELHVQTDDVEIHLKKGRLTITLKLDTLDYPADKYEQVFGVHRIDSAIWYTRDKYVNLQKEMVR